METIEEKAKNYTDNLSLYLIKNTIRYYIQEAFIAGYKAACGQYSQEHLDIVNNPNPIKV